MPQPAVEALQGDRLADRVTILRFTAPSNLSAERGDLRGFLACGLGVRIGADARGLSATIVVSGTFGEECLDDDRSNPRDLALPDLTAAPFAPADGLSIGNDAVEAHHRRGHCGPTAGSSPPRFRPCHASARRPSRPTEPRRRPGDR